MKETVAGVFCSLCLIALVWVLCFYSMEFNILTLYFGILGTALIAGVMNVWVKTKKDAYLANKYDENRRQ